MAVESASPVTQRRPVPAGQPLEPLGPRALRIGLRTTLLAPLGAAASVALVADDGPGLGTLMPVFLAIVAVGAVVALMPWSRVHGTSLGRRVLHAWAILNVVLISLAGWSTGGSDAVLPLAYAVTIVFFAVLLSPRAQLVYLAFLLACYGAVMASSELEPIPLVMLGVLGFLASFLSGELRRRIAAHERARIESERRWAVVGSVSKVARDMAASEPRRVLQGVVDAIVALGYETAAIHLPSEASDQQVVLPGATAADPTRGIRTLPDAIRSRVMEEGRDVIVRAKEFDRQGARTLRAVGIEAIAALPILVGARPEGVLLVGSTDPDGIGPTEVEAFAMLAATASMALGNARRAEEAREVAVRVADADRVRHDVMTRLAKEIRKPLAAVTQSSKALRDAGDDAERTRLLERLATSANALDVTLGGSLDLSLLEAKQVELHPEEFDLGELVSGVLERLAGSFEGRDLRANVPTGLKVEADRGLIELAVEHLLVTSATASAPGKTVEVAVSRTGAETTVKVAGDGAMPADQLARLKQPFTEGNGTVGPLIRLALASKILELHGSELQIRSETKQGTRVWFQLPGERANLTWATAASVAAEGGPVQLTFDDETIPAAAANAAAVRPPAVELDEEEERRSTPFAAAAVAATAASSLVVTGILPDLLRRPELPAATSTRDGSKRDGRDDAKREERSDRDGSNEGSTTGSAGGSPSATSGGTGTTSEGTGDGTTGDSTGGGGSGDGDGNGTGGGGGAGGGGGSETPSPSPEPPPPGEDGTPGNSGEAPGHNKDPEPTPTPSPTP
jgi:signal transduction histidine kinase